MNTHKLTPEQLADITLGEIVTSNFAAAEVLKTYDLDFCCGGKRSLREACDEKKLDTEEVASLLAESITSRTATPTHRFENWTIPFLIDYVVNEHHAYTRKVLPELEGYLQRVCKVHGMQHPELKQIHWYFEKLQEEMTMHLQFEEKKYFPLAKAIASEEKEKTDGLIKDATHHQDVMMDDHEETGRILEKMRELSNDYTPPADACNTYILLYNGLDELEDDIKKHVHLENNILIPKVEYALSALRES